MADLPERVAESLLTAHVEEARYDLAELRKNASNASNIIRHSAVRRFDEIGIGESKAQSGLMATDVGGPTNAAGGGG